MEQGKRVRVLNEPGMARARALIKAVGYDTEDLRRPRIGVANTYSETSPGHSHLRAVADAVKAGIWQAGGTPCEFGGFGMCPVDVGSAGMRYDTPTRDIIAAEVETCAELHAFDGLVLISSCEVDIPGRRLDLLVSADELEARRSAWTPPPPRVTRGLLTLYARLAEPAERGAGLPVRLAQG